MGKSGHISVMVRPGSLIDRIPKLGTRRRVLYDVLVNAPGQWVEFDPIALGYNVRRRVLTDLRDFREVYEMDIRTAGSGTAVSRWMYAPRTAP